MKPYICVPTYNEAENIRELIDRILHFVPEAHVVVIDDNSPDGTWRIVQEIARQNPQVHLIHRTKDRGRGLSGIVGFKYCIEQGADVVFEMDGDFSHDPRFLPEFIKKANDYDVVSGSRFVYGGKDAQRGWIREMITFWANVYIRLFLRIQLTDCSSGYRCYKRHVLENIGLDDLISTGPSIVQEILFKSCAMNYTITEIPIEFVDRTKGETKLTYRQLINGFVMVLRLRFGNHKKQARERIKQTSPEERTQFTR